MKSIPKHPWCKKSCGQEFKKRPCWKRCEIKMGGQGLLLLMELKVLIMMTRLQNITRQSTVMFCVLVIIIKTFNSINSRRPWPPILISHLFQHGLFLNSWPQHQGCFGRDIYSLDAQTCTHPPTSGSLWMWCQRVKLVY